MIIYILIESNLHWNKVLFVFYIDILYNLTNN
jgi:hypothetical protein